MSENLGGTRSPRINLFDISIFLMLVSVLAFEDISIICLGLQALVFVCTFFQVLLIDKKVDWDTVAFFAWGTVFSLLSLASQLWTVEGNTEVLHNTLSIFQTVLIGVSILLYCNSQRRIKLIISAFVWSAVLFTVRFFLVAPISSWGNQTRFSNDSIFGSNANAMSMAYIALILVMYLYIRGEKSFWKKLFAYFGAGVFLLITMLMGTKAGILGFGIGIILFLICKSKNPKVLIRNMVFAGLAVILGIILVMNVPVLYNSVGYRMETMVRGFMGLSTDKSTSTRMLFVTDGLRVFMDHPILGVGMDGYRHFNSIQFSYAHNTYIELLADLGFVGFGLFYLIHLKLLFQTIKQRDLWAFIIPLFVVVLAVDVTTVSFSSEMTYILLAFMFAMLRVDRNRREEVF